MTVRIELCAADEDGTGVLVWRGATHIVRRIAAAIATTASILRISVALAITRLAPRSAIGSHLTLFITIASPV